jgi:hypothetical protein
MAWTGQKITVPALTHKYLMPPRGYTSSSKGIARPHLWSTGPDPVRHKRYKRYLLAGCQARHFRQGWEITWPEWESLIQTDPEGDTKNVCRRDCTKPWTLDNMILLTRTEMLRRKKAGPRPHIPEGVRAYGRRLAEQKRNLREFTRKDTNEG